MNENADMDALYSETKPVARPGERPKPKSIDEQEAQDMAKTALVPLKAFKNGCEVGQKYTIEVVADHGEEVEVKVVEGETEPKPEMAMAKADDGDDGYAEMLKE
jgi:hypothetical protein